MSPDSHCCCRVMWLIWGPDTHGWNLQVPNFGMLVLVVAGKVTLLTVWGNQNWITGYRPMHVFCFFNVRMSLFCRPASQTMNCHIPGAQGSAYSARNWLVIDSSYNRVVLFSNSWNFDCLTNKCSVENACCCPPMTYWHRHIHAYTHTHIHTHIHTYMHAWMHASIHPYIHTYIHTNTHIHTYIHTYLHTYIARAINLKVSYSRSSAPRVFNSYGSWVLGSRSPNTPVKLAFGVDKINNKLNFCMELGNNVRDHLSKVLKNPRPASWDIANIRNDRQP